MDKSWATWRLGDNDEQAARWIGISREVYRLWPEVLHPVMADRVYAAIIRREAARAMGMSPRAFLADYRGEYVIEGLLTRVSIAAVMAHLLGSRMPPELAHHELRPYEGDQEPKPARKRPRVPRMPREAASAAG
jgi:hypothetical protein